jgi:hypothetical protein
MSLVINKRSVEDDVQVLKKRILELQNRQNIIDNSRHREIIGSTEGGNELEDTNIDTHDDTGIMEGLARASMAIERLSLRLESLSSIERRLITLESVSTIRTVDFNILERQLNTVFMDYKVYHAVYTRSRLYVDYYISIFDKDADHRWESAEFVDNGGDDRIRARGKYTSNMFHNFDGFTRVYPGSLNYPVTFLRQKNWGGDPFATRMAGKGGQYPSTADFYSSGSTYKTIKARVLSYPRRAFKMREGSLTKSATAANAFKNFARYAGAGALAAVGAEFGAAGLFVAGVLAEELFHVNINTLISDLENIQSEFDDDSTNTIIRLAELAMEQFKTAPGQLIPSDYAEAHVVDGVVAIVTKEQSQGYYLNGSPGGGPTNLEASIFNILNTATQVGGSRGLKYSKPQTLVDAIGTKMDTRIVSNPYHYKCPMLDGGSVIPDYYITVNLSPNVSGSDSTDWKSGTYSNFSLHDGDGLCLWGRLWAVFDYDTSTWMMYDHTGAWVAV